MQFTEQGKAVLTQLLQDISSLKNDQSVSNFILPTIELFFASIQDSEKVKLKTILARVLMIDEVTVYQELVIQYLAMQRKCFSICIVALEKSLQDLIDGHGHSDQIFHELLDFLASDQLHLLIPDLSNHMNPAIQLRLTYFLIDKISMTILLFQNGNHMIITEHSEASLIKRINQLTAGLCNDMQKTRELYTLFYNELQIREASIMTTGMLPRLDQLSDIYTVYKIEAYALKDLTQSGSPAPYYQLAVKTLSQLSKAYNAMQGGVATKHLSLSIKPFRREISMSANGLVQRSAFGINIDYLDMAITQSDSIESDTYYVKSSYHLKSALKIAYLQHVDKLSSQMLYKPKHAHQQRRMEKLAALKMIIDEDNHGNLSPNTFKKAKSEKPYLFVAWGLRGSETESLITQAETDIKKTLLNKLIEQKDSIGQYGYALNDENLLLKLLEKYKHYTAGHLYNPNQKITDFMIPNIARNDLTGIDLWRFDKKMALEIILIANEQQLLHPALIYQIEHNYPQLYARSLPWLFSSEIEKLIMAVKDDVLQSFYDAENLQGLSCLK
jgi:hypothetical protein